MRVFLRVLLVGWMVVAACTPAEGRPITGRDEMQNPGLPVQQPDHILTFPKPPGVTNSSPYRNNHAAYDIALSADGSRLVYTQDSKVLNAWYVVVWAWPEIVLALLGMAVLWGLWRTLRRRVRDADATGPVCAKCGYATRGLTRDSCPECGGALAGRGTTTGLTRSRKRVRLVAVLAVAAGAGAAYLYTDPPRHGQVSYWFNWRSEGLADRVRLWDIDWMERLIQDATAVRDVPIDDSSDVHTITLIPQYKDPTDILQVARISLLIGGYPRPYANDRLHLNLAGTRALVNNELHAVRIDLATLEHTPAPGMTDGPNDHWYSHILDDTGEGRYRFQYRTNRLEGSELVEMTVTHSERGDIPYTIETEIVLPIRIRSGSFDQMFASAFGDEPVPATPSDRPYRSETIRVQPVTAADGQEFFMCFTPPWRLSAYVSNGYVVVLSDSMIYLFNLDTSQWIAALDPTPVHGLSTMDATATSLSADRRWFAVRGYDGERVAVYRLPEPSVGP